MDQVKELYLQNKEHADVVILALAAISVYRILTALVAFNNQFIYKFFCRRARNLKRKGKWAVVTGGSDGIGLGYAKELAKKGMSVCLIARNEEKLQSCCEAIKKKSPKVEVSYIVVDFMKLRENKAAIQKKLDAMKNDGGIGVLINNVGISYPFAQFFHELPEERADAMVKLNVEAMTDMTRMVITGSNGMVERKRGAVVAIGSAAGYMPIGDPLYSVYSGSKAYADFFSRSMAIEYKAKGLTFECHVPYLVPSKLSKVRGGLFIPQVPSFARAAIKCIGQGEATVIVHYKHAIENFIYFSILPRFFFLSVFMKQHFAIRKKGFKKMAAAAKAK